MCYLFLKRSHSFPLSCVFRDSFAEDRTLTWGRLEPPRICDWTGRWEQTEAEPGAKTLGENERPTRFVLVFFFVSKPKRELCNMSLKHHRFSCRWKKGTISVWGGPGLFFTQCFPWEWTFSAKINHPYYLNKLLLVHFLKRGNTAQSKGV